LAVAVCEAQDVKPDGDGGQADKNPKQAPTPQSPGAAEAHAPKSAIELPHGENRVAISPRQLLRQLPRLQSMMQERLDLTPQQNERISSMFDRQIAGLRDAYLTTKDTKSETQSREEIKEIQRQLIDARKERESERAAELSEKLREILRARQGEEAPSIAPFLAEIRQQLSPTQAPTFDKQVELLGLDEQAGSAMTLRRFMQAVMSPDVALTVVQRREVREIISEQLSKRENPSSPLESDPQQLTQLQEAVMAKLTPEQRAKVEALLRDTVDPNTAAPPAGERNAQ